jgi:hypothetical protein
MWLLSYPHEAEWTTFHTNYFSETVIAAGTETGTSASVARVTRIGELGTRLSFTLMMEMIGSSETPVLATVTLRHI